DVASRQVDVLATRLERLLDVGAFAEFVPRLGGQNASAAGDGFLQLALVASAVVAIDVEAVPLWPARAVLRVLETRPNLGHRQLGRGIEAERRRAPRVQALARHRRRLCETFTLLPLRLTHHKQAQAAEVL